MYKMLQSHESALVNNLKGRVSKVLTAREALHSTEIIGLECAYKSIDRLILSAREERDIAIFKQNIISILRMFGNSPKKYIQKNIIPVLLKIADEEWGTKNE